MVVVAIPTAKNRSPPISSQITVPSSFERCKIRSLDQRDHEEAMALEKMVHSRARTSTASRETERERESAIVKFFGWRRAMGTMVPYCEIASRGARDLLAVLRACRRKKAKATYDGLRSDSFASTNFVMEKWPWPMVCSRSR